MRKWLISLSLILACGLSATVHAQSSPASSTTEQQVRILFHAQEFKDGAQVGWAGWAVWTNVLKTDPARGLFVAGVAFRDKQKTRWVEIMPGIFADSAGNINPVIDVRAAENYKSFVFTQEALYDFRAERLQMPVTASTAAPFLEALRARFGLESDISYDSGGWHIGLGPRFSIVIPKTAKKATLVVAYQQGLVNQPKNIIRWYVLINK